MFELRYGGSGAKNEGHLGGDGAVFESRAGGERDVDHAVHPVGEIAGGGICPGVVGDADDGAPVLLTDEAQVFTDGVVVWEKAARGFGANDDRARVAGGVGLVEITAAKNWDAQGAEVSGRDGVEPEERRGLFGGGDVVFDIGRAFLQAVTERDRVDERGFVDT